jgi:predicted NAD-dependent protein-ADP-ribosyltransferase YbiA (DUF1768 family)
MTDKKILDRAIVHFFSGKKEYRSLSNFWEEDVKIQYGDGLERIRTYPSGEHCFHGEKYIRLGEICTDKIRKEVLIEHGKTFLKPSLYKNGKEAKKMGRSLLLTEAELNYWSTISIDVQKEICRWKFENFQEVREDLIKSGNKILVHPAMRCSIEKLGSRVWEGKGVVKDGKVIILGKNMLGTLWMYLR